MHHIFSTFLVFLCLISGGEPIKASEYFGIGRVTEFKYGLQLSGVVRKSNGQKLSYLKNFGEGWGMMPDGNAFVFVDNHDNQRGHGGGGGVLTFREPKWYKVRDLNRTFIEWGVGQVHRFEYKQTK